MNPLSFETWKELLEQDCALQGKDSAFSALGESVLTLLWESGFDPTVEGISHHYQDQNQERLAS